MHCINHAKTTEFKNLLLNEKEYAYGVREISQMAAKVEDMHVHLQNEEGK